MRDTRDIVARLDELVHGSESSEIVVPVELLCRALLLVREQAEMLADAALCLQDVEGLLGDLERCQGVMRSLLDDDDVGVRIAVAAAWEAYGLTPEG